MITIMLGGLTHHYVGSNLNYCNKVSNFGSIINPYTVAMYGTKTKKAGIIVGKDSVCGNIIGPITSFSFNKSLDVIAGGYNTNKDKFNNRQIQPMSIGNITPVLGLNYKIPLSKSLSLNNVISFGIITHAIGIEF